MSCGLQSWMEMAYSEARVPHRQALQQGWGLGGQPEEAQEGAVSSVDAAFMKHVMDMPPVRSQQQRGWARQPAAAGPRQAPPGRRRRH